MSSLGNIIFDMDGTLIDSMEHHAKAFGHILKEWHGVPEAFARYEYYLTAGSALDDQFRHALAAYDENQISDIHRLIEAFWNRVSSVPPRLMPSVSKTIPTLTRAGYVLFLTSGSRSDVVRYRMANTQLDRSFALILGTDETKRNLIKGEPHFEIFRETLRLSKSAFRRNTLFVGDGRHDMELGRRAGFVSVGLISTSSRRQLQDAGAHFVISEIRELETLLRGGATGERSGDFKPIVALRTTL